MPPILQGYEGVIDLVDTGGNIAKKTYQLRAATHAQALTDLNTIMTLLAPLTEAEIRTYRINTVYTHDDFAFPTGGVQVENIAEMVVLLAGGFNKVATVQIPAPEDDVFMTAAGRGYNIVDPTEVFAYIDGVYGATGGLAFISDGESTDDTAPVISGKRIHRASRRG